MTCIKGLRPTGMTMAHFNFKISPRPAFDTSAELAIDLGGKSGKGPDVVNAPR